jgi:myo-inositol-1(or 4)-monophosphatase
MKNSRSKSLARLEKSCVHAALEASEILRRAYLRRGKKGFRISQKGKRGELGLVTEADLAAEERIVRVLRRAHPEMGFLTEEGSVPASMGSAGRFILDPLDGTTNFVHGFPMFCVSIAAEWEGRLVAGVIHHPIFNETYVATVGQGARLNGKRIRVSGTRKLNEALVTTGFSYTQESAGLSRDMRAFAEITARARAVRRPGSAALDLAYTACGIFDGFWERNLSAWDVSAGILLVREAGGKCTDYFGKHAQPEDRSILATNSWLHSDLCTLIKNTR